MALSTSTSTLAAGASRTFNLSSGSALTLVVPPNVRATVTETPNTVSASDVGGNASRTHNLQMVQTVTYGPYPMGGTVVVANASNSGATITWVRSDSIVAESAAGAVSLVDGAGNVVASAPVLIASKDADIARVIGVHYPQTEGSGATFLDSGGDGVDIAVGGTTAGAWANAGWFTHHSAGNAMAIKNDPFIDNIIDMSVDGSIIVGTDVYFTAWPTGTEVVWSMHRSDLSSGGIRFPAITTAGRIALYYRPNGGTEIVALGHNMSSGYLGTRISTLFEFAVDIANNSLRTNLWVNGEQVRSNTIALGSPPTALSTGGMQLSGYGTGTNYLGSSGAGTPGNNARTRNAFALRHSGADRNIAARLAKYVYDNNALPTWLVRS